MELNGPSRLAALVRSPPDLAASPIHWIKSVNRLRRNTDI